MHSNAIAHYWKNINILTKIIYKMAVRCIAKSVKMNLAKLSHYVKTMFTLKNEDIKGKK